MNGKDLLAGMSYMDEHTIAEELSGHVPAKGVRLRNLRRLGVLAACVCIAVTGIFMYGKGNGPLQEKAQTRILLSEIDLNEFDRDSNDRKIHLPNNCVEETWNRQALADYFGRDLWPVYIPEGLTESPYNNQQTIFRLNENIYLDEVYLDFYHGFNNDGMPMWTEDAAAEKGFTLTAWKKGLSRDYMWASEEDQLKTSVIGDTEVVFGYRKMEYGPYDEKSHAPAGAYDLYVATFMIDDVHYEFVSHQLPLDELVKVVTSFICQTEEVEVI